MINKNYSFYIAVVLCLIFELLSCNYNQSRNNEIETVLAKIGNETITVNEFRNNYELGFSNLKSGENKKKTYLNYMINEKLLMLEGYEIGLEKSENVLNAIESLKRELLIESLIKIKVKDKLRVTEDEIKESINKSKVRFKFRYWFESTKEKAKTVVLEMQQKGYAKVIEDILLNNPENRINPKFLETDYLNYEQVPPEILIAIKDVPYGEISDPVEINNKFYIFQVLDIRRNAVTENEYKSKASSVEQVIFYQKLEKALIEYGTKLLDSKKIKTKRKAFNILADAIWEWKNIDKNTRMNFVEYLSDSNCKIMAFEKMITNSDDLFFEYEKGSISIKEFINYFDTSKFLNDFKSKKEFKNYLHSKVALTIRDIFLVKEANLNKLGETQSLQKEILLWENKWVYEELRSQTAKAFSGNINAHQEIKSALTNKIEELRNTNQVEIYESILDTINVVDFEKSKWATMQIFKSGSNRPAYPVVDPRLESLKK